MVIDALREIVRNDLNEELETYKSLKIKYDEMSKEIIDDNSEKEYINAKKSLKKEYSFRKRRTKEYKDKLQAIEDDYKKKLEEFYIFYKKYAEIKDKLAHTNIYDINNKLENIDNYDSLKDFKMKKDAIQKILKENNLYDNLTEEELKELKKLR